MLELFESIAYILVVAVIVAAWLPAYLLDALFGVGFHPWVSTIIGSVIGLVILLISPIHGEIAMIAAAVCSAASSFIQDKIL